MALNKRKKSLRVLEYVRTSSVVTAQRRFPAQFKGVACLQQHKKMV